MELALEKGGPRDLAGTGEPRARTKAGSEHGLHYHRPAVSLKLEHRLPRVRMGCREIQHDTLVDTLASGVSNQAERGVPRLGQPAGQRLGNFPHFGAREANDADSPSPDRRGDPGNGVPRYLIFS